MVKEKSEMCVHVGQLCPRSLQLGCVKTVAPVLHPAGTPLILFLCTPPWPLSEGCPVLHPAGTPLILFLCTPPWPLGEGCPAWSGATGRALSRLEHMHGSFMTGAAPRLGTAPCLPAPRKPSPCSSPRSARFSLKSFSPHRHNHWV